MNRNRLQFALQTPLWLLVSLSLACDGSNAAPFNPAEGFNRLGHDQISYTWLFPAELTGEQRKNAEDPDAPLGWTIHSDAIPIESVAWIKPMKIAAARQTVLTRDALKSEIDKLATKIIRNAEFLAPGDRGAFSILLTDTRSGRDRMGNPVEVRVLALELDSNDEKTPSFVTDWAARQMGGASAIANRHAAAGQFSIAIAMMPLVDAFGNPALTENGDAYGAFAVWVAVPGRLNRSDDFQRLAVDFADVFPIATKFAAIGVTTETLTLPDQNRSIAIMATFDGPSLLQSERSRVRSDFLATLDNINTEVELRVGIVQSCEAVMVKSPGADDFVSSLSDNFEEEIIDRFDQMFLDDSLDCLSNMSQRSAIIVAQNSSNDWSDADERWFFWLTKRPENATVSLSNILLSVRPNEYSSALKAEKASYFAVGAANKLCNDSDRTTAPQEPDVAFDFENTINALSGTWIEYCSDWPTTLGDLWATRAAVNSDLLVSKTPLPGSLQVFSREASVPEGGIFGYREDRGTGSLIPGDSVDFSEDDIWTVSYTTIYEPEDL